MPLPPAFLLGTDDVWVAVARDGESAWRVTADWGGAFKADFKAHLTDREALRFAERFLAAYESPRRPSTTLAVTEGRNNPLSLTSQAVDDEYAFYVALTPNGDDNTCMMRFELNPLPTYQLYMAAARLRDSLDPA